MRKLDWMKGGGLIPAVVQDARDMRVLMVGWMNQEALKKTQKTGKVTFYSRSKKRLWTKGETSGNILRLRTMRADCDGDTLLIEAVPSGPTCHRGTATCFDGGAKRAVAEGGAAFLDALEQIVDRRFRDRPRRSYVSSLIDGGLDRMAQKVGEEGVETVIASKNKSTARLESEAADLLFHLMVLLRAKGSSLARITGVLRERNQPR